MRRKQAAERLFLTPTAFGRNDQHKPPTSIHSSSSTHVHLFLKSSNGIKLLLDISDLLVVCALDAPRERPTFAEGLGQAEPLRLVLARALGYADGVLEDGVARPPREDVVRWLGAEELCAAKRASAGMRGDG